MRTRAAHNSNFGTAKVFCDIIHKAIRNTRLDVDKGDEIVLRSSLLFVIRFLRLNPGDSKFEDTRKHSSIAFSVECVPVDISST